MIINTHIKQLYYSDDQVFSEIIFLLRNTYGKELTQFFIYTDENYPDYLKTILLDERNFWIYYCINDETNEFLGFAIFKKEDSSLFLSQIIIAPRFQHAGLGEFLLMGSINNFYKLYGSGYFKYFELETFISNVQTCLWYQKLGMKISDISNWYIIGENDDEYYKKDTPVEVRREDYELITDGNGFLQLFYNRTHIGLVINQRYVRLRSDIIIDLNGVLRFLFQKLCMKAVCINSRREFNLPLLDQCISFRIPFSKMVKLKSV